MNNTKRTFRILHKDELFTDPTDYDSLDVAHSALWSQIKEVNPGFAVIISIIGNDLNSMKFEYYYTAPIPY